VVQEFLVVLWVDFEPRDELDEFQALDLLAFGSAVVCGGQTGGEADVG
jgi:hypothetical protein